MFEHSNKDVLHRIKLRLLPKPAHEIPNDSANKLHLTECLESVNWSQLRRVRNCIKLN